MTTRQLLASTATLFSLTCMAACADSDDDPAAVGSAYSLTSSPAPTESEPDTTPLAEPVNLGGRSLFLECQGSGSPTVVLEAGLTGDTRTWERVAPAIAENSGVCAYDRANVGQSDPAPTPRSAQDMVEDLDAVLRASGEESPFVLVGFSFGGLVSQLYAATHPGRVAGIVLVESSHPDEIDVFHSHLTTKQVAEDEAEMQANPEGVDLPESVAQVQAAPNLPNVPLVVVSAARSDGWPPGWDATMFDRLRAQQQHQLAALVPNGEQVIADHSGHAVPQEQPEAVIDAIKTVLRRN
jgi:pimeloyl-ACP methyl ester carboxylesterase